MIVEETPSSQPELYQRVPIRAPGGFVACGNGGLGFGVAGSVGLRMGNPERPVVAVVGDGSSMYAIQAPVECRPLRGRRAAPRHGQRPLRGHGRAGTAAKAPAAWPAFGSIDIAGMARCLGCPAINVTTYDQLIDTFDEVLPELAGRREPLLVEIAVG